MKLLSLVVVNRNGFKNLVFVRIGALAWSGLEEGGDNDGEFDTEEEFMVLRRDRGGKGVAEVEFEEFQFVIEVSIDSSALIIMRCVCVCLRFESMIVCCCCCCC